MIEDNPTDENGYPVYGTFRPKTPVEKAEQLLDFYMANGIDEKTAKLFVRFLADNMINSGLLEPQLKRHILNGDAPTSAHLEFWFQVKKIVS